MIRLARSVPTMQHRPEVMTNRIHESDCIGVLCFLLQRHLSGVKLESCYLATDDKPVSQWQITSWLSQQLSVSPPIESRQKTSHLNKRCSNQRLKAMGYHFLYADYRQGYLEMISDEIKPI